jgi:hypothetical protein
MRNEHVPNVHERTPQNVPAEPSLEKLYESGHCPGCPGAPDLSLEAHYGFCSEHCFDRYVDADAHKKQQVIDTFNMWYDDHLHRTYLEPYAREFSMPLDDVRRMVDEKELSIADIRATLATKQRKAA